MLYYHTLLFLFFCQNTKSWKDTRKKKEKRINIDTEGKGNDLSVTPRFFFSVLMTANFKAQSIENMEALLSYQPNRPILVSEFWPGWFDHWFEPIHNTLSVNGFTEILTNIFNYNASVNFYMFHGGTNFGFMNGANHIENYAKNREAMFPYYAPDVTSYGNPKKKKSSIY